MMDAVTGHQKVLNLYDFITKKDNLLIAFGCMALHTARYSG